VVVLDGLDWEWVNENRDDCPELWAMAERGCHAPLRAPSPPLTPASVAALLCGREPSGMSSWTRGSAGQLFASSQDLIRRNPWPRRLAREEGTTVGLCNVPLTFPAFSPGKGCWLVSGYPMAGARLTVADPVWFSPVSLNLSLQRHEYPIGTLAADKGPGGTRDVAGLLLAEILAASWAAREAPPVDVLFVWLRSTDGAGHHSWGEPEYASVVQGACKVAAMVEQHAGTTLVISDHGFDALDSERCRSYRESEHGPFAQAARLRGGHAEVGVLFAAGELIRARGELPEQRLVEVAGGLCDLLQVPPPDGVLSVGPAWASPYGPEDDEGIRERMKALGYVGE